MLWMLWPLLMLKWRIQGLISQLLSVSGDSDWIARWGLRATHVSYFPILQSDKGFGIINILSWLLNEISSKKYSPTSRAFDVTANSPVLFSAVTLTGQCEREANKDVYFMEPSHKDQRRPLSFPNLKVVAFLDHVFEEFGWKSPGVYWTVNPDRVWTFSSLENECWTKNSQER